MIVDTNMNAFDYIINIQTSLNSAYRNHAISFKDWYVLMLSCLDLVSKIKENKNGKN